MRVLLGAALIAGALLRIAILPIGVPVVDDSWRAWSHQGAVSGPWNLYGPRGHVVSFGGIEAPVVYPPLALDELALLGRAHLAMHRGRFNNDVALTRTIKGAIVLLDVVLSALLFVAVTHARSAKAGWWAAMGYWANPAALMTTTLGYIDVFLAVPAAGAVVAASSGRPWLAGGLLAAAVLTKPQGLFVAPVVVLALWNSGAAGGAIARLRQAAFASLLTAALVSAPVIAVGKTYYMLRSIAVLAGHDMLSALAYNGWWIVSYLFAAAAARPGGWHAALTAQPEIVTHAYAMAHGMPNPRVIGLVLLGGFVAWALNTAQRTRDLGLHAALGGLIVVAYFTLSVQVHENHFFLALPLLAIAAALRPAFAAVGTALSAAFALNLYLPFGVNGDGAPQFVTGVLGLDASVVVAAVVCGLFAWLAAVFARECRMAAAESR